MEVGKYFQIIWFVLPPKLTQELKPLQNEFLILEI